MKYIIGIVLSVFIFLAGKKFSDECVSGLNGNQFYAGVATEIIDIIFLSILYTVI